jgi:hypothetical protein
VRFDNIKETVCNWFFAHFASAYLGVEDDFMSTKLEQQLAMQALGNSFAAEMKAAMDQDLSLKVDGQIGSSWGQIVYGDYICVYQYFPTNQLDIQIGEYGKVIGTRPLLTLNGDMVNNKWVDKFNQRQTFSQTDLVKEVLERLKAAAEL